jgi:apolipoprotein N-acyltransferase
VAVAAPSSRGVRSATSTFVLGLVTGLVYFVGTVYWVVGVMRTFGSLSTSVAVLVGLLLASYLALYPAFFALLLRRAIQRFGEAGLWLAPVLWVATEWLRGVVGGGFPWVLLGASQATVTPIVQLASITGVYGLSALVALVSTAAAAVAVSRRRVHRFGAIVTAAVVIVVAVAGAMRVRWGTLTTDGRPMRVGLVQGSVEQVDKYDTRFRDAILRRYLDLSRETIAAGANLVVWPEASTPFYFDANTILAAPVRALAAQTHTPFIIGTDEMSAPERDQPEQYYNSAVFVGADGRSRGTYRKMHLVPFGEYVPLRRALFFVAPLVESVGDLSPGTKPVVFDDDGRRLSVAICYESVYPEILRSFVVRGSELLVTITNDAWFDRSSAAYQHFAQGSLRAVEEGRYVVRAANTGVSGAIDPYGRVLVRTDLFVPVSLAVDVRLLDGRTIYNRIGNLFAWLSTIAAGGVALTGRRKLGTRRGAGPVVS